MGRIERVGKWASRMAVPRKIQVGNPVRAGMRWFVIAATLAGCGATPSYVASAPPVSPREVARVPVEIVPAELADPGVMNRITKRARIRVVGRAWLTLGGTSLDASDREPPLEPLEVLAETREHLRVISEDDSARVALWILRDDALPVPVTEVQLTDERGVAPTDAGVWLEAGAKIAVHRATGDRREITLTTDVVSLVGWMPSRALGAVWTFVPSVTVAPTHQLGVVAVRAAPSTDAAVLATTLTETNVAAGEARGEWRMVELRRDGTRIRGWVPVGALAPQVGEEWGTIGLGSYSTSSHTLKIDVPEGTCLFAGVDAEVVGVATKQKMRLGYAAADGWQRIMVGTPWGTSNVYLRITPPGFESCLP